MFIVLMLICFKDTNLFFYFCTKIKKIMKELSFVLLGSNMGDRIAILNNAIDIIECRCGRIVKKSSLYESEPWGFDAEQNFLNQAICVETELSAHDLLKELLNIEKELGRKRYENKKGYESRPIDLDVIYYGDMINDDEDLILPHPRLHLRKFVLMPLCEIAADFIHPVFNKTNLELMEVCNDTSEVVLYQNEY